MEIEGLNLATIFLHHGRNLALASALGNNVHILLFGKVSMGSAL